jgi:hypothetical protein
VIDAYRTCEFATVGRTGTPVAWPVAPLYRPESGTFVLTTSIGLAEKANNVRRNPRVALLFSDPTGSGLGDMPEVLVQGTATCLDDVVTSPAGLEEYWIRLLERQPSGRNYGDNPVARRAMGWYYQRLVITVTPTRIRTRPPLHGTGRLTTPSMSRGRGDPFAQAARRLSDFTSGVLVTLDADGTPALLRVRPNTDAAEGMLVLDVPTAEPVRPGPASLLCHSHDDRMGTLRSFVALGNLAARDDRWELTPTRLIPGADPALLSSLRFLRKTRRSANTYLQRRGLAPQPIPWAQYQPIKTEALRREALGHR